MAHYNVLAVIDIVIISHYRITQVREIFESGHLFVICKIDHFTSLLFSSSVVCKLHFLLLCVFVVLA